MKDFRELKVWQKAHELTLAVCKITSPKDAGATVMAISLIAES
jgi:hypothetical protein